MAGRRLTQRQRERIERLQARHRELAQQPADSVEDPAVGSGVGGLVISHQGRTLVVEDAVGQLHRCTARQNLGRLACGDRVVWQASETGGGVVMAVNERHSLLTRPDHAGLPRPLAANVDSVAVVLALTPEPSEYLIDRYLIAITAIGARVLLVLNKVDLLDDSMLSAFAERLAPYQRIGYQVLYTSSRTARGLDELRSWLQNRTSLLAGQSGVGKSSLVKALLPDREIRIQAVSVATGHGTHTTSASTLYHLPDGGDLIDTPGVRSFELGAIGVGDLERGFPELEPYLGRCRFSDCRHEIEPNCALRQAVACGAVAPRRLDSYLQLHSALERERRYPS